MAASLPFKKADALQGVSFQEATVLLRFSWGANFLGSIPIAYCLGRKQLLSTASNSICINQVVYSRYFVHTIYLSLRLKSYLHLLFVVGFFLLTDCVYFFSLKRISFWRYVLLDLTEALEKCFLFLCVCVCVSIILYFSPSCQDSWKWGKQQFRDDTLGVKV